MMSSFFIEKGVVQPGGYHSRALSKKKYNLNKVLYRIVAQVVIDFAILLVLLFSRHNSTTL